MSAKRIAYLNGKWLPEEEAKVSIFDRGFTLGDGIYEAMRTFEHRPFKAQEHVERLYRSLKIAHIAVGLSASDMLNIINELAERNADTFRKNDDFMIYPTITRGVGGHPLRCGQPTIVAAVKSIGWGEYANFYLNGAHLITSSVRRQPPQCWDAKIKTTSRFHHTLADIEVSQIDPNGYCLMLDLNGNVAENRSSNVGIVRNGVIEVPSSNQTLRGVSMQTVFDIARDLGIQAVARDLQMYDFQTADEIFMTSTSFCVLPVSRLNSVVVGDGACPGPITSKLIKSFGDLAGVDIIGQARSLSNA